MARSPRIALGIAPKGVTVKDAEAFKSTPQIKGQPLVTQPVLPKISEKSEFLGHLEAPALGASLLRVTGLLQQLRDSFATKGLAASSSASEPEINLCKFLKQRSDWIKPRSKFPRVLGKRQAKK